MAEQEACASAVTVALAASGDGATESGDARGESLLLPLLQGLLGSGGEKLLAGLGAAGADVVADVRRSLGRLRAALAPPAAHPQARALLQLADRLEDALAAADRLDGCRRRPRRRSRAARHTVGVTQEELAQARRLVDRDQLSYDGEPPLEHTHSSTGSSTISTAPSGEPTPERRQSVDDEHKYQQDAVSYREAEPAQQKRVTMPQQKTVEAVMPVPAVESSVERRAPGPRRPDFFRHSIADAQPQPPPMQGFPRMERRTSEKSGITAITNKFNAQIQKENAPPAPRRVPVNPPPAVSAPVVQQKQTHWEESRRAPLYKPLPPTYNFAAPPPAEEPSKPLSRFNSKRNRMKRANTIDIGRPLAGYRLDSDTDEDSQQVASLVPPFRPQTENDRKFVAFMQRNEEQAINGFAGANWSNRFGNIKNAFESRERDDHSRSSSSSRQAWRGGEPPRQSRRAPADVQPSNDVIKPPWAAERRPQPRAQPLQQIQPLTTQTTPPSPHKAHLPPSFPPVPQSPTKPVVVKPFAAKPIPVNQFSHAPMSAFQPVKKIVSPTTAPAGLVWSPPSVGAAVSPSAERPPSFPGSPRLPLASPPPAAPWATDKPRRTHNLASRFEGSRARGAPPPSPPRYTDLPPPTYAESQSQSYPVRSIPSQNNLAAPELVKKIDTARPKYDAPAQTQPLPQMYGNRAYEPPQPAYQPPQQTYEAPRQTYQPPQQTYHQHPQETYQIPQQTYRSPPAPYDSPRQTYAPPEQNYDQPKIDARKLQIEFYEKQIREKARREAEHKPPPPYTVTDYTPPHLVSTFVPLHQTPDIEKARAHKIDYLPDVVLNETGPYEPSPAPAPRPAGSPKRAPATHAHLNGDAGRADETTEHDSVETRVMRGPVRGVATTTSGPRTRYEERAPRPADSLRGVLLDKLPRRPQVPAPAVQPPAPAPPPAHAPAPRSPLASPASAESCRSAGSSPLARSGSWHQLAAPPAPKAPSPRRIVSRAKSMHLLAVPKLFEGGIANEELTEKKRTVEAYFSGQTAAKSYASAIRAKASGRAPGGGFALGRSRTMPAVTELQFLDESNADDAFEDLVSGLA